MMKEGHAITEETSTLATQEQTVSLEQWKNPLPTKLYEVGVALSGQMRNLLGNNEVMGGWHALEKEAQTTSQLAHCVTRALSKQDQINKATVGLAGLNFAVTVANVAATKKLAVKLEASATKVSDLELAVVGCNRTIDDLNDSVCQLEIDSEMHRERGVYLQGALEHNTSLLKTTLAEQQHYKATQDILVANQRSVIAKMHETSERQWGLVDSGFGLVSYLIVNSAIVNMPMQIVFGMLPFPHRRGRVWSKQAAKLALILTLTKKLHKAVVGDDEGAGASAHVVLWNMTQALLRLILYMRRGITKKNKEEGEFTRMIDLDL